MNESRPLVKAPQFFDEEGLTASLWLGGAPFSWSLVYIHSSSVQTLTHSREADRQTGWQTDSPAFSSHTVTSSMSAPRFTLLPVLLLLLGAITLSQGFRKNAPRCCFNYVNKQPKHPVISFTRTSQLCPTPAVLFRTVTGRQLCARPSDSWVVKAISVLENKKTGDKTPLQ